MGDVRPIVYAIDADDVIVSVNDRFEEFAAQNGAPCLGEQVLGRSLFDFVAGPEPAALWRLLLARVRASGAVSVPFRCDAADVRRELRMELAGPSDGSVVFRSVPVMVEGRAPVELFDHPAPGREGLLRACSWCCRFDVDGWVEAEEAVARLRLLSLPTPRLTHGLCEECFEGVRARLDESVVPACA